MNAVVGNTEKSTVINRCLSVPYQGKGQGLPCDLTSLDFLPTEALVSNRPSGPGACPGAFLDGQTLVSRRSQYCGDSFGHTNTPLHRC